MKTFFMLLILFHVASTGRHSLEYFYTSSDGLGEFPEFVGSLTVDGVQLSYWDSDNMTVKMDDWTREFMRENPDHLQWYSSQCLENQHEFRSLMDGIRQQLNQSEGVHVLQMRAGCEWDDDTRESACFMKYGYDGEDFMALDTQQLTWRAETSLALTTKLIWDADEPRLEKITHFYMNDCPRRLKKYLPYVREAIGQTVLPSVSLLQKSPTSPVRCFSTGFYPDRAVMFWRKDGEEIHEGVDHGEILPNTDHTFQMSADLDLPSEDWEKYECVFQLAGVMEDIVTRLEKPLLTNFTDISFRLMGSVIVVFAVLLYCLMGFWIWIKKTNMKQTSTHTGHLSSCQRISRTILIIGSSIVKRIHYSYTIIKGSPGAAVLIFKEKLQHLLPSSSCSVNGTVLHAGTDDTSREDIITHF